MSGSLGEEERSLAVFLRVAVSPHPLQGSDLSPHCVMLKKHYQTTQKIVTLDSRGTILLYTVDKQPWNHELYRKRRSVTSTDSDR